MFDEYKILNVNGYMRELKYQNLNENRYFSECE